MHCIHCGRKLPDEAKFCPDCGKTVQSLSENPLTKKPSLATRLISLFIASAISSAAIVVVSGSSLARDGKNFLIVIFAFLLLFTGIFFWVEIIKLIFRHPRLLFSPFKKLFMLFRARPKLIIPTLGVLAILVVVGQQLIHRQLYQQAFPKIEPIQTVLAEALVIKSVGDDIGKSRTPAGWSMKKVDQEIQTVAANLALIKPGILLGDYREQSALFMAGIKISAEGSMKWEELPDQPPYFRIALTDDELLGLFKDSLKRLADLKEFGDGAIKRGDRAGMRYIAAKLAVQDHFLNSLSLADDPSLLTSNLAVYAREPISPGSMAGRKRNPCFGPNNCLVDATRIIPGVWRSALGYTVGEADAGKNWQESFKEAEPLIEASGYPIGGTGITQGDQDKPKYSPAVQSFMDGCKAKGGRVGGTGGVKERLPTTEGGYDCQYEQAAGQCWDRLTYSGGRYMGGNPGCPEQGLLPRPPEKPIEPSQPGEPTQAPDQRRTQPPVTSTSWDGVYDVNANVSCNVPGMWSSGLLPSATRITVKGNRVFDAQGGSYPINSSGQARMVINVSYSGVGVQAVQTFNFSRSGTVSGNISLSGGGSVEGTGFSINCSGSFSGSRVSS